MRLPSWLRLTQPHLFILAVTLVFLAALLSRTTFLEQFPPGVNQDEAANGYDAYALGLTGRDHYGAFWPLLLRTYDDWVPVTLTYMTVPVVRVLGLSATSIRLVTGLTGVLTCVLIYVLAKQLGLSRWTAITAAALIGLGGWHIHMSRFAIPPSIVPFFTVIFFLVMFHWLQLPNSTSLRKRLLWGVLLGVSASALTHAYSTLNFHLPVFFVFLGVVTWFCRPQLRLSFLIMGLTYAAIAGPLIWITLAEPDKYNARFQHITILRQLNPTRLFHQRYSDYLSFEFLFGKGDRVPERQMQNAPIFPLIAVPALVVGIIGVFQKVFQGALEFFSKRAVPTTTIFWLAMIIWVFLSPIAAALTIDRFHIFRVAQLFPALVLAIALGFELLFRIIQKCLNRRVAIGFAGITALWLSVSFCLYVYHYTTTYPPVLSRFFGAGIHQLFPAFLNDPRCKTRTMSTNTNQPYMYYLFYSQRVPDAQLYQDVQDKRHIYTMITPKMVDGIKITHVTQRQVNGLELIERNEAAQPISSLYLTNEGECILVRQY